MRSRANELFVVVVTALAISGCGGAYRPSLSTSPLPTASQDPTAEAYLESGQYRAAALEYQRLAAGATAELAEEYRLRAASAFIGDGDIAAAEALLRRPTTARRDLMLWHDVLRAEIAVRDGRGDEVVSLVSEAALVDAPTELAVRGHELRAQAFANSGDPVGVLSERLRLDALLPASEKRIDNRERIWSAVTGLDQQATDERLERAPQTLAGWLALADTWKRTTFDRAALEASVSRWRSRYPDHPAQAEIVPQLLRGTSLDALESPAKVALLVPLEGPFAEAGRAVRDGFVAAWNADVDNASKPDLSVRDTSNGNVREVYTHAVNAGAELVVGPLQKGAVNVMASTPTLAVPTLALNQPDYGASAADAAPNAGLESAGTAPATPASVPIVPRVLPPQLFQFALSPEGEAQQVAERAWFDGYQSSLVMVPDNAWGTRVADAFTATWESLGGQVLESRAYPDDAKAMSLPVKVALGIADSEQRYQALKSVLGRNVQYQPRRRQDVDFIFIAAFPKHARLLRPLLKFHHASRLPVYATSHVYSGVPNPAMDEDIDDVAFGDMPWILTPEVADTAFRQELLTAWPRSKSNYWRLLAFGADAYALVGRLGSLRAQPGAEYDGQTGRLYLSSDNTVGRRLTWARFKNGTPRLIDADARAPASQAR